jgi:PleD family two-component response regulator
MISRSTLTSQWLDLADLDIVPPPDASLPTEGSDSMTGHTVFQGIALVPPCPEPETKGMAGATESATILVVDDEVVNAEILKETLRSRGYRILVATGGRECLAIARQNPPDLILLDVMMPEMGGLEVCRILKAIESSELRYSH